jgi:histidinol-phosphate aminotransferase
MGVKTRRFLRRFKAYAWETPTREIASAVGLPESKVHRLDTNTSPFLPVAPLRELKRNLTGKSVNQYPDTSYLNLRRLLSSYSGREADRFVVTNGADEGLDIIVKTFLDPGDQVVTAIPTYSMFRVVTEIMDGRVLGVKRRKEDFGLDLEGMLEKAVDKKTKLIFLCSPNNPTGNLTPIREIERIVGETETFVAVDEAYFEFAGKSAIELTDKYDNIVLIRTFSKAFSMAGVRVGYLVASKDTVIELNKVRPPNSLSVISLQLAESALRDLESMRRNVGEVVAERERMFAALGGISQIEPYPSQANFILFRVKVGDGNVIHSGLMKKGFVLRNLTDVPGIENSLRLTISRPEVNDAFLAALESTIAS